MYRLSESGEGRPLGWQAIAENISEIPLNANMSEDRVLLANRFEFYQRQLTPSKQTSLGVMDESHTDIVSKDWLTRWFKGQPPQSQIAKSRRSNVAPEKIAAVRDFLLEKGFLYEFELEQEAPDIAPILALNHNSIGDNSGLVPEFYSTYLSYSYTNGIFTEMTLQFELVPDARYVRVLKEVAKYKIDKPVSLKAAKYFVSNDNSIRAKTQLGWLPFGLLPSLTLFLLRGERVNKRYSPHHISVILSDKQKITQFETMALDSYREIGSDYISKVGKVDTSCFVHDNYDYIFEFFDENMHTDSGYLNFQTINSVEGFLYKKEDMESGKALFDEVVKLNDDFKPGQDYLVPVKLIEAGASVNYFHEEWQTSTLHMAAEVALRDTLYAMMEDEELNYLVKDGANRLPSDLAFRVNEELGQLLAEKQVEQARREGINMQEFLSPTLPASGDVFDPFAP